MHFTTILLATTTVLAGTAFAAPKPVPHVESNSGLKWRPSPSRNQTGRPGDWNGYQSGRGEYCLSDNDAEQAADIFRLLIQEYTDELALSSLTEDFVDYSSAVNIIMNKGHGDGPAKTLTEPTFVGRQAFMDGQGSQPEIPFTKLNIFHGCDSVSMRWMTERSANGQKTETASFPVIGNVIIEVVEAEEGAKYNFRIKTIFSEFNAAAWLLNLGIYVPQIPAANLTVPAPASGKRSLVNELRGNMI